MTDIEKSLARFGKRILLAHRENECCDIDGGTIQEIAEQERLLIKVRVTESCGDDCHCAEWSDFPQDCLRLNPEVRLT